MNGVTACPLCEAPIITVPTDLGHEAAFDAEIVVGGPWRLGDFGVMHRPGAGPRRGYTLHQRRCGGFDTDTLIPREPHPPGWLLPKEKANVEA